MFHVAQGGTRNTRVRLVDHSSRRLKVACVFITAVPIAKLFAWGGGKQWRTCATRDDEPRPVWTSLPITH
jgi:hypothetical protein